MTAPRHRALRESRRQHGPGASPRPVRERARRPAYAVPRRTHGHVFPSGDTAQPTDSRDCAPDRIQHAVQSRQAALALPTHAAYVARVERASRQPRPAGILVAPRRQAGRPAGRRSRGPVDAVAFGYPSPRLASACPCAPRERTPPLSSRGLGRRPLTAETRVRIPVAVLRKPRDHGAFSVHGNTISIRSAWLSLIVR